MLEGKSDKSLLEQAIDETRFRETTPNHQIMYVRRAIERRRGLLLGICVLVTSVLLILYVVLGG